MGRKVPERGPDCKRDERPPGQISALLEPWITTCLFFFTCKVAEAILRIDCF